MIKTIFTAAVAAALLTTAAQAGDLKPLKGQTLALQGVTGSVYYTAEADSYRVVATLGAENGLAPVRFVARLTDGQAVSVEVPAAVGVTPVQLEIRRTGDRLSVGGLAQPEIRASLD
ncbi:hypothetical protein [Mangrovicella endophytica]|uniref:hypothetical protein n=1 Tax=Mangrovicella endophytica TaxID=2066697 RepID=UPI000C9E0DCF|nr:hypothetical protein [Mangrovicella endophytica]